MMRYPLILLAATMAACDAAPPPAAAEAQMEAPTDTRPLIWEGARKGMTVDEVKAVLPQAVAVPDAPTLDGGVRQLLGAPDHVLGAQHFAVEFLFNPRGELFQVSLKWKPTANSCGPLVKAARDVVAPIRAGAGTEVMFIEEAQDADSYSLRGEWVDGDRTVTAMGMCLLPAVDPIFGLVYRPADAPASAAGSPFSARTTPR